MSVNRVRVATGFSAVCALAAVLASGGCQTTPPIGQDPDVPGIYVVNADAATVTVFALDASGDAAPRRTLGGDQTGLNLPLGIGIDTQNRMFVANRKAGTVTAFPITADGNVAPSLILTDPDMGSPSGIAIGPGDGVFVSTCPGCGSANGGQVGVFHFATGSATSDFRIGGTSNNNTGFTYPGSIALDWDRTQPTASANLIVQNAFGGVVSTFAPGIQGDQLPIRSFSPGASVNAQSVATGNNAIFVSLPGPSIAEYPLASQGNSPASSSMANYSASAGTFPGGIVIDTHVTPPVMYVVDYSHNAVYVIQTAGVAPFLTVDSVRTISGPTTGLHGPTGIAVITADLHRIP